MSRAIADANHKIINFKSIKIDPEWFNNNKIECNDGIEASVVSDEGVIYFSVETKGDAQCHSSKCYVLIGQFNEAMDEIIITDSISIPKSRDYIKFPTNRTADAGFESLTMYNGNLLAIFERPLFGTDTLWAFKINPDLKMTPSQEIFKCAEKGLRFADIASVRSKNKMGSDTLFALTSRLKNKERKQDGYDYFILKSVAGVFTDKKEFIVDSKLNWEGFIHFENGFLFINDNCFGCADSPEKTFLYYWRE